MDALRFVADRLDIQNLYARYCFALDRNDLSGYLSCFTQDAVLEIGGLGTYTGHGELATIISGSGATRARHQTMNLHVIEQGEELAHCEAYFLLCAKNGENSAHGTYDDVVVKDVDGAWRWSSRDIDYLWTSPTYSYGR